MAGDFATVYNEIEDDVNILLLGFQTDVLAVVKAILEHKKEFLLTAMDNILISKSWVEVVVLELPKPVKNSNRSLFIDINQFRSNYLKYLHNMSIFVGIAVICVSGNENFRELVGGAFSKLNF